jgi:hypothetical protein
VGELYLACVESASEEHGKAPEWGFDAAVEFAPDWTVLPERRKPNLLQRGIAALNGRKHHYSASMNRVYDYTELTQRMMAKPPPNYRRFPGVTPGFDNAARRQTGSVIFADSTPDQYKRWLSRVVQAESKRPVEERIVFINAWNEWAEGNHLEPCQKWGRAYLEATREALLGR